MLGCVCSSVLPRWLWERISRNTAVKAVVSALLALLCIAAAVTVFFVPVQKQQPQAQYLLKDNAGRLALYTPYGTGPLAQYDVYTRLLPEPDCLALQQGVSIYTEAELQQKLEDYGL